MLKKPAAHWTDDIKLIAGSGWMRMAEDRALWWSLGEVCPLSSGGRVQTDYDENDDDDDYEDESNLLTLICSLLNDFNSGTVHQTAL